MSDFFKICKVIAMLGSHIMFSKHEMVQVNSFGISRNNIISM
jgi:hypothetical protein